MGLNETDKYMTKNTIISLKDIYDVVNRMEDKMDKRLNAIEGRVDVLEDFRGWILGGLTIIGIFVSGFATWVWKKLG